MRDPLAITAPPIAISGAHPEPGNDRRTAVLVCHGMGRQVRWATLNDLVTTLRRQNLVNTPASTRLVQFSDAPDQPILGRVELTLSEGGDQRELHVYEAYWAPITEGRVTLRDVASFLFNAGFRGAWYSFVPFNRLLFNKTHVFQRRPGLIAYFGLALATVAALFVLNASVAAALTSSLWGQQSWFGNRAIVAALSRDLLVVEAASALWLLAAGIALVFRRWRRRTHPAFATPRIVRALLFAGFIVCLAVISYVGLVEVPMDQFRNRGTLGAAGVALTASLVLIWAVAAGLSLTIRWFLIQYVGDVAAYVSSHTVSKFDEIRDRIRKIGMTVGSTLYDYGNYDRYVIVGHSLGSVIAYDTLNGLLNRDAFRGDTRVLDRTQRLITFGSPLDKTAFVFRGQGNSEIDAREALATAMQPLICNQKVRIPWVNLWSWMDIISGRLDYYGDAILNRVDPQADIPLVAHVQFWENQLLARELADACFGRTLKT